MIKLKMSIEDISEYQTGILPKNAVKIETPQSIEEMMKKAAPIAAVLCVLMFVTMLCKTVMNKTVVISHVFILIGFCLGYICLVIHEWLHGIVYPRNALVTIGKITGKISFVALASYPLKRRRFIVMCLLPFVLGIIPLLIFIVSPADYRELNGLMFGMSCMGMVSPFPDVYNVFIVLKNANKKDAIMFYKNDSIRYRKFLFMEVYIMRVIISIILMVIAALVGFFFGAGMNEAMGGAILLSMITGFACTINAIEKNKKD